MAKTNYTSHKKTFNKMKEHIGMESQKVLNKVGMTPQHFYGLSPLYLLILFQPGLA